jgi:hypothetical protein
MNIQKTGRLIWQPRIAQRADNALQRFAVLVWLRFNIGGY